MKPDLKTEAKSIATTAELGRPGDLEKANARLREDAHSYTASQYGELLKQIKEQNGNDRSLNGHLPQIEFSDSNNAGIPDKISIAYDPDKLPDKPLSASANTNHGFFKWGYAPPGSVPDVHY